MKRRRYPFGNWNILFLDLETANDPTEVDWDPSRCEISCGVTIRDPGGAARMYGPDELEELAGAVERCDALVTFNGIRFDIPVLGYAVGRPLLPRRQLDLYSELTFASRSQVGWGLGATCKRTIGVGKSALGSDAPGMYDRGEWGALFTYCLHDVKLLRRLFWHAHDKGSVIAPNGKRIPINVRKQFIEWSK